MTWAGGLLGQRVGEARHPGKDWLLTTTNVTSLREHEAEVVALKAEVTALQETKLTAPAQRAMTKSLHQAGLQAFFGRPVEPAKKRARQRNPQSPWTGEYGGVGVLVDASLPAMAPPNDTPLRRRLWDTRRWVHVAVGYGNGGQVMHIMSVYGHTNAARDRDAMERNETLLADVLAAAAALGNVPVLVMGDLNVPPEKSAVLQAACATGAWYDLAEEAAGAGGQPAPTCFASPDGTRIDLVFGNAQAAPTLRGVEVPPDAGLPVHRPVQATLDMAAYAQERNRVKQPRAFPTEEWEKWPKEREALEARRIRDAAAQAWAAAERQQDVAGMWRLWNEMAEEYLTARSGEALHTSEKSYRGRGRETAPQKLHLAAHQ